MRLIEVLVFRLVTEGLAQKAPKFCQEIMLHSLLSYSTSNPPQLSVYSLHLLLLAVKLPCPVTHPAPHNNQIFSRCDKTLVTSTEQSRRKFDLNSLELDCARKAFNFIALVQLQQRCKSTTYADILPLYHLELLRDSEHLHFSSPSQPSWHQRQTLSSANTTTTTPQKAHKDAVPTHLPAMLHHQPLKSNHIAL